jgi:hypothetical protein
MKKILKGGMLLPLIFLLTLGVFCKVEEVHSQEIDLEGYDPNTEVIIEGEIQRIVIPEQGLVSIILSKHGKQYKAFLCPRWFYFQLRPNLKVGDRVEIRGAKIYTRRHGLVFAVKILKNLSSREEIIFRNETCEPCWKGRGRRDLQ